jgi:hypothetical protein
MRALPADSLPTISLDLKKSDCRGVLLSGRDGGMEGEGVRPVCCDHAEEDSKHNLGEGFGEFDEDEFLVDKEGMGGRVNG